MIGLQGRGLENKLDLYFSDMNQALSEMKRVTKNQSPIVIIVGNNEIQTKGVRLDTKIIELGENQGFHLDLNLKKPIRGLQNSMKEESILFFSNRK
jgi:ubiquinone/menaquinone biosynthesis C-methylase UbiE